MKFLFPTKHREYETYLRKAIKTGLEMFGHTVDIVGRDTVDVEMVSKYDFTFLFSITTDFLRDMVVEAGGKYIYMDKGYCRNRRLREPDAFVRISPNSWQPLKYLDKFANVRNRWKKVMKIPIRKILDKNGRIVARETLEPKETKKENEGCYILYAGSSNKYHRFMNLDEPTAYAENIVQEVRKHTDRPIIYRPKPSWDDRKPVPQTIYMGHRSTKFNELVKKDVYALITHSSNAALEANLYGIPTIVLGEGIARPISSTSIEDINNIYRPTLEEKHSLGRSLSYFQWRVEEIKDGHMWRHLKDIFEEELSNGS